MGTNPGKLCRSKSPRRVNIRVSPEELEYREHLSSCDSACRFLLKKLKDGPRLSSEILHEALRNGISERTLSRAVRTTGTRCERTYRLPEEGEI
jgi:hypothetical protein